MISVNDSQTVSKDEIRTVTLDIFKKVLNVCNKLDIQCWVMYGTLIGAVRHQGFIPWDDDFDIIMKRSDYDKFISSCENNKELLSPYYVDHFTVNSNYPFYIARICDSNHVLKFNNFSYTSGIFIDLYPFDGMGNSMSYWRSRINNNKYKLKNHLLQIAVWEKNVCDPFVGKNIVTKSFRKVLSLYVRSKSNKYWMSKIDKESRQFDWNDSEYVGVVCWGTDIYKIKRKWFDKTKWLQFENIKVPVPGEYKKILEAIYGDYMRLPPKEKQIPTHWYKVYRRN